MSYPPSAPRPATPSPEPEPGQRERTEPEPAESDSAERECAGSAESASPPGVTAKLFDLKRIRKPLTVFALGVLLAAVAYFLVYPSPPTGIPTPAPSQLSITTSFPVTTVIFRIRQAPTVATILVDVVAARRTMARHSKGASAMVSVQLPPGSTFRECHAPACHNSTTLFLSTWTKPLTFKPLKPGYDDALVTFRVGAHHLGVNSNGLNAYAAIPEVSYSLKSPQLTPPTLLAFFSIPSPTSFDWSSLPYSGTRGNLIGWAERLTNGTTPAQTAVGVNHTRQATDDRLTFAAGILLGLAGAIVVAAFQEALHTKD